MRQLRQPRLAEIVAARLRDDILSGRLKEGDLLPRQEHLFKEFQVSLPAVREAMRILETEGLVTVRRGNVGGAVVHLPTPDRVAQLISMVLQSRSATLDDLSGALPSLEPVCARMCAARPDRMTEVVPGLSAVIEEQQAQFDDVGNYNSLARRFHETLVANCGNQAMIIVIGSLEAIWSAHESTVWDEARKEGEDIPGSSPMASITRRVALADHEKILAAIEAGNEARAEVLLARHLAATRKSTLATSRHAIITANLVGEIDAQVLKITSLAYAHHRVPRPVSRYPSQRENDLKIASPAHAYYCAEGRESMIARPRKMFGFIGAIAGAGALAGALIASSGPAALASSGPHQASHANSLEQAAIAQLNPHAAQSTPPSLKPPTGNVLAAQFVGIGVQVYQCTAGAWVFHAPAANLVGRAKGKPGVQTAIHYAGPTWQSTTDGSLVQGATVASSPVPGSIPQLLLKATTNQGTGVFGTVTYINRLDTRGGAAPTGSCTSGQSVGVRYSAQYLFYVPKHG